MNNTIIQSTNQKNEMDLDQLLEQQHWNQIPNRIQSYKDEVYYDDIFLRTPLHRICAFSFTIQNDISYTNSHAYLEYIQALKALIAVNPTGIFDTDEDGRTPLHHVCANSGDPYIISILLQSTKNHKTNNALNLVRAKSRHQRNTALHELCRWGNWNAQMNAFGTVDLQDQLKLKAMTLLLNIDPTAGNTRNRMGITPLYLLFGYWLNKQDYSRKMVILDTIRFHKSFHKDDHILQSELEKEFFLRWRGVLIMIQAATSFHTNVNRIYVSNPNPNFLYLHSIIDIDRTWPIFDLILHLNPHQCHIKGISNSLSDTSYNYSSSCKTSFHQNKQKGDYPLVIAARTLMSSTAARTVIRSLLHSSHTHIPKHLTSNNDTLLCSAIRGGKTWYTYSNNQSDTIQPGALQDILYAYPEALRQPDIPSGGLYPFMLAALDSNLDARAAVAAHTPFQPSLDIYDTIYSLLREAPDLVSGGIVYHNDNDQKDDMTIDKSLDAKSSKWINKRITKKTLCITATTFVFYSCSIWMKQYAYH